MKEQQQSWYQPGACNIDIAENDKFQKKNPMTSCCQHEAATANESHAAFDRGRRDFWYKICTWDQWATAAFGPNDNCHLQIALECASTIFCCSCTAKRRSRCASVICHESGDSLYTEYSHQRKSAKTSLQASTARYFISLEISDPGWGYGWQIVIMNWLMQ